MTRRTGWIVFLAFAVLTASILADQEPLALSSLSVLLWVGMEWIQFRLRTADLHGAVVSAHRHLDRQQRSRATVIVDQPVAVETTIQLAPRLSGLQLYLEDLLPGGCQVTEGSPALQTEVTAGEPVTCRYTLRSRAIRRSMLSGLELVLSDPAGLFRARLFYPLRQELTTLPYLVRPQTTVSILKRRNVQMLLGSHAHRKAGTSMELLGIRQYRPGDPPRWIAWKPTARLGQLMTCEYESEVPVRATILADVSPDQFVGRPGPSAADRTLSACASLARLLLADRDPVACLLTSGDRQRWLPHGLGERHLTRVLWHLLESSQVFDSRAWSAEALAHAAWRFVQRRYPELLEARINPMRISGITWGRRTRRLRAQRAQLSYAIAGLFGGPPGLPLRLQMDDDLLRDYCRRILSHAPEAADLPVNLFPALDGSRKMAVETLCRGLLGGVSRASDNELFVVIATLPRDRESGQKLMNAIRLARAAYHRVILVDVAQPPRNQQISDPDARRILGNEVRYAEPLAEFTHQREALSVKLGRLEDGSWMQKVAAEVDLLRAARARGTSRPGPTIR